MKTVKHLICALLIAVSPSIGAHVAVKGMVVYVNSGRKAVSNIQIITSPVSASPAVSHSDGVFTLEFPDKNPGDHVNIKIISKEYTIINSEQLAAYNLPNSNADTLRIEVCLIKEWAEMLDRKTAATLTSINTQYQQRLSNLRKLSPNDQQAFKQLEENFIYNKNHARDIARFFLSVNSDYESGQYKKFITLVNQGKYDEALNEMNAGELQRQEEERKKSTEMAQSLIDINKKKDMESAQNWFALANLYKLRFQFDDAEKTYLKAFSLDTSRFDHYLGMSIFLFENNRLNTLDSLLDIPPSAIFHGDTNALRTYFIMKASIGFRERDLASISHIYKEYDNYFKHDLLNDLSKFNSKNTLFGDDAMSILLNINYSAFSLFYTEGKYKDKLKTMELIDSALNVFPAALAELPMKERTVLRSFLDLFLANFVSTAYIHDEMYAKAFKYCKNAYVSSINLENLILTVDTNKDNIRIGKELHVQLRYDCMIKMVSLSHILGEDTLIHHHLSSISELIDHYRARNKEAKADQTFITFYYLGEAERRLGVYTEALKYYKYSLEDLECIERLDPGAKTVYDDFPGSIDYPRFTYHLYKSIVDAARSRQSTFSIPQIKHLRDSLYTSLKGDTLFPHLTTQDKINIMGRDSSLIKAYAIASVFLKDKKYDSAIVSYDKVLSACDTMIPYIRPFMGIYADRGLCFYYLGRYTEAIEDYKTDHKIRTTIDSDYYYNNLGTAYIKMKNFDLALSAIKKYEEISTDTGRVYRDWAMYHAMKGDDEKAFENLEKAIKAGYKLKYWYMTDSSMSRLRDTPRYRKLLDLLD